MSNKLSAADKDFKTRQDQQREDNLRIIALERALEMVRCGYGKEGVIKVASSYLKFLRGKN